MDVVVGCTTEDLGVVYVYVHCHFTSALLRLAMGDVGRWREVEGRYIANA